MSTPTPTPIVLVVEDETLVRTVMVDALQEEGFTVVEAGNAEEALQVLEAHSGISVVVTDAEMPPGRRGFELAKEVSQRWPSMRVVISSGRAWPGPGDMPESATFLPKPWTAELLAQYVWEAEDRARASRSRVVDHEEGSAYQG
jgi:DNA-binding NtrC family response regulator